MRFAIVPKFYGVFFDQSGNGCKDEATQIEGVECVYRGPQNNDALYRKMIEPYKGKLDRKEMVVVLSDASAP